MCSTAIVTASALSMAVSVSSLRRRMAELVANDDERHLLCQQTRHPMPQIMNADIGKPSSGANTSPWLLQVDKMVSRLLASDQVWIASSTRELGDNIDGGSIETY